MANLALSMLWHKRALVAVAWLSLAACSPATTVRPSDAVLPSASDASAATAMDASPALASATSPPVGVATAPPVATNVRVNDTTEYELPQLIPFDGIPPVYEPIFAGGAEAPLLDDELVIGIALGGEAKAYPITVLRFREMVDDELGGIPTLVTW